MKATLKHDARATIYDSQDHSWKTACNAYAEDAADAANRLLSTDLIPIGLPCIAYKKPFAIGPERWTK